MRVSIEVSKDPDLFDLRGFSWSLLSDLLDARPVRALEAWFFYVG